nr:putative reverse transcriptase domain-containing protein [Tanacetum cinerariifolium]
KDVTCFNCNEKGHRKRDCPKLKKNGQGGNNHGAVYKLRAVDAQQDPKVITVRASYRLVPFEIKELSEQLKELSEKGFVRPSSSPWGAP